MSRLAKIDGRNADQSPNIVGIKRQGPLEQVARRSKATRHKALIPPGPTLKPEVHRTGVRRSLRASSSAAMSCAIERTGKPCNDFVLHVEEVSQGFIEPFRPKMMAALGVNELDADPHPDTERVERCPPGRNERSTRGRSASDRGLAPIRESRITSDYEGARRYATDRSSGSRSRHRRNSPVRGRRHVDEGKDHDGDARPLLLVRPGRIRRGYCAFKLGA